MTRILTLAMVVATTVAVAVPADAQSRRSRRNAPPPEREVGSYRRTRPIDPAAMAADAAVAASAGAVEAEAAVAVAPAAPPAPAELPPPVDPAVQTQAAQEALTRLIGELQAGAPDYSRLETRIAEAMRGQQAALSGLIKSKGALQGVDSLGLEENGARKFRARFERDSTDFGLSLNAQGQINGFTITD